MDMAKFKTVGGTLTSGKYKFDAITPVEVPDPELVAKFKKVDKLVEIKEEPAKEAKK